LAVDLAAISSFDRQIMGILAEPVGAGGLFATPKGDGSSPRFRHSWAVGMRWLASRQKYTNAFGNLPAWIDNEHPHHRSNLIRLALESDKPLPALRLI
jgi:hypothetical protein